MLDLVSRLREAGCVFAEDEARLLLAEARTVAELDAMVERRTAGLPLEQVLGWAEFCGLRVRVAPGVFVPRRRTEFLAQQALAALGPTAVELCCGTGAISAVLLAARPVEVHAVDLDPTAVRCARENLPAAWVYEGDLYEPLPARLHGHVDVLVANAPYVPNEELELLPPEARLHEPRMALDGGSDGLDVLRRVIVGAPRWLAPGGQVLVETSERQAPVLVGTVAASGLVPRVVSDEELGATVVIGTRATGGPDAPGPARR
jgi:release factor glutamine methyltransferase